MAQKGGSSCNIGRTPGNQQASGHSPAGLRPNRQQTESRLGSWVRSNQLLIQLRVEQHTQVRTEFVASVALGSAIGMRSDRAVNFNDNNVQCRMSHRRVDRKRRLP